MITKEATELLRRSGLPTNVNDIIGKTIALKYDIGERSEEIIFSLVTGVFLQFQNLGGGQTHENISLAIAAQYIYGGIPIKFINYWEFQGSGEWMMEVDENYSHLFKEEKTKYAVSIELIKP